MGPEVAARSTGPRKRGGGEERGGVWKQNEREGGREGEGEGGREGKCVGSERESLERGKERVEGQSGRRRRERERKRERKEER